MTAALTTLLADADTDYVAPSFLLVVWSLYVLAAAGAAIITASKARWGWLLLGIITFGIAMFIGATRSPMPRSLWTRLRHRDASQSS